MKVKTKVQLKRIAMGQAISQFGWELLTKWHFIMFYQKYINYLHFTRIKNKTVKKAKITSIFKKAHADWLSAWWLISFCLWSGQHQPHGWQIQLVILKKYKALDTYL